MGFSSLRLELESPTRTRDDQGPVTQAELSYLRYLAREYSSPSDSQRLAAALIAYVAGFAQGPQVALELAPSS